MALKNIGLRKLTTWIVSIGIIGGIIAPTLELYNIITHSNKIVIALEVIFLTFLFAVIWSTPG